MRRLSLFLIGCILTLTLLPVAASAEEGQFRIGVVGEYVNQNWGDPISGKSDYGTDFGFLLGYEKRISDSLWYDIGGKVLHGPRNSMKITPWRETNARAVARIGTVFHYGLDIKPFVGVGVNYTDQDIREGSNFYYTDYILPVGVSLEKDTDYGLIGADIQYEYVVHRELWNKKPDEPGMTSTFGGNCNLEIGFSFEPKDTSIGFRPYYRYEHAYRDSPTYGWWGAYNKNIGGLEIYYHF